MKKELIAVLTCTALLAASGCGKKKEDNATDIFAASPTPAVTERYVTVSVGGNVTLTSDLNSSDDESMANVAKDNGKEYFFRNISDFFTDDDLTLVNLDCVISAEGTSSSRSASYRADKDYLDILKSGGIEAVNLANGNTIKFDESGLEDTKAALDEAGISWTNMDEPKIVECNGVKVGLIGVYVEDEDYSGAEDALSDAFESFGEEKPDVTIVSLHWDGDSEIYEPSDDQQELARAAVDLGANLVACTNPFPIQGVEKYNGAVICYSLGNLCYGAGECPDDYKDSFIFRQTFTLDTDGTVLDDDAYEIVPLNVSSKESMNNYQPTPAEPETRFPRIEKTITDASEELGDEIILWFNGGEETEDDDTDEKSSSEETSEEDDSSSDEE